MPRRHVLLAAVLSALPTLCPAQTNTWTATASTSWSAGPWVGPVPSWGGSAAQLLQFNNPSGTSYTAGNDLGSFFLCNGIILNSNLPGTITVASVPSSSLALVSNGSTLPMIAQRGSTPGTVSSRVHLSNLTQFGDTGTGTLTISGRLTGTGSLSINAAGVVALTTANTFSGGTTLDSGTLLISNADALGTSTLYSGAGTLACTGTLRVYNPVSTVSTLNYGSSGTLLLNRTVSGSGGVRVGGNGLLGLAGTNTYTGGTTIAGSTEFEASLFFSRDENLGAGGASVEFAAAGGNLVFGGQGSVTVARPVSISGSAAGFGPGYTTAEVNFTGNLTGAGYLYSGLYNNGGVVQLSGANSAFTGDVHFYAGTTRFDSDQRLGTTNNIWFDGGTAQLAGNWTSDPGHNIVLSDSSAMNTGGFTAAIGTGIQLAFAAGTVLYKNGDGTLLLGGQNNTQFVLNSGAVVLAGNGSMSFGAPSFAAAVLHGGSSLIADNTSTNLANRIANSAAIHLSGGALEYRGSAGAASTETVGTITLLANTTSTVDLQPGTGQSAAITSTGLNYQTGAGVLYRAQGLGGAAGTFAQFKFNTAPSGAAVVGGGGAPGTTTISVLSGSFGDDTAGGAGSGLVTYDPTVGVRLLASGEYATGITPGAATSDNVALSATASGLNSPTGVNALVLSGGDVSGTGQLIVSSGLLLSRSSGSTRNITVATLALGTAGHVRTVGDVDISSAISTGTLNKSGPGVLTLSGANTFTGPLNITQGTLRTSGTNVIPDTATVRVNQGATWELLSDETVAGLSQQNNVTTGVSVYGTVSLGGTLTVGAGNVSSSYAGRFTEAGRLVKTGTGTFSISDPSTAHTGGTELQQGTLKLDANVTSLVAQTAFGQSRPTVAAGNMTGTGSVMLSPAGTNSATLLLGDGIRAFDRPIAVQGVGAGSASLVASHPAAVSSAIALDRELTISTNGASFSGTMSGSGGLILDGSVLTSGSSYSNIAALTVLSSTSSSFTGTTTVRAGAVYTTQSVQPGFNGPLGSGSSIVQISPNTATPVELSMANGSLTFGRQISVDGLASTPVLLGARPMASNVAAYQGTITLGGRSVSVFSGPSPADQSAGMVVIEGPIVGTGSILVGAGFVQSRVAMRNQHTYSGGTTLNSGTLMLDVSSVGSSSGPLGTGPLSITPTAGVPTLASSSTFFNAITVNGDFSVGGSGTATGTVSLGSVERVITTLPGADFHFTGVLTGGSSGAVFKEGAGTLTLGSTNTYGGGTAVAEGTLVLGASQNMSLLNIGTGANVLVAAGANKVLVAHSLNMATGARVDLTDNDMVVDYTGATVLGAVQSLIAQGYDGGSWYGNGITSSSAAASSSPRAAIGFVEANDIYTIFPAMFSGATVDATSVLLRYTVAGDANIDGTVNGSDFNLLAMNFGILSGKSWYFGDFTYDGAVNSADFNVLAGGFGYTIATQPGSSVPEPAAGAVLLAAVLLTRRRTHRRKT